GRRAAFACPKLVQEPARPGRVPRRVRNRFAFAFLKPADERSSQSKGLFFYGEISWFDARGCPAKLERSRFVFADDIDFPLLGNLVLHADGPVAGVDEQAAQP